MGRVMAWLGNYNHPSEGTQGRRIKRTKVTFSKWGYVANIQTNGVISRDASLHSSLSSILEMA